MNTGFTPAGTFPGTVSTDTVKISWAEYASLKSRADSVEVLVKALELAQRLLDRNITYVGPSATLRFESHHHAVNEVAEIRRTVTTALASVIPDKKTENGNSDSGHVASGKLEGSAPRVSEA